MVYIVKLLGLDLSSNTNSYTGYSSQVMHELQSKDFLKEVCILLLF